MKTYYVTLPREKRIYFTVEAEDSREARCEAVKHLVIDIINEMVSLDIIEGDEVQQCQGCAHFFNRADLNEVEGILYCGMCKSIRIDGVPEYW